jgi:hypothetical protein
MASFDLFFRCWLEEDYIWAFLGPVAVVILVGSCSNSNSTFG